MTPPPPAAPKSYLVQDSAASFFHLDDTAEVANAAFELEEAVPHLPGENRVCQMREGEGRGGEHRGGGDIRGRGRRGVTPVLGGYGAEGRNDNSEESLFNEPGSSLVDNGTWTDSGARES